MNIDVNGRFRGRPTTGVERYAAEVLRAREWPVNLIVPPRPLRGLAGHFWEQVKLPTQVRGLLWSPANTGPLALRRQVVTIHDVSPLDCPAYYQPAFALWYRLLLPSLARRVRRVITQSNFSRARIIDRLRIGAERVTVIPPGINRDHFRPVNGGSVLSRYRLPATYLLFVGSMDPRKNLPLLLRVWAELWPDFPEARLVIVGGRSPIFRRPTPLMHGASTRFLGRIPDEDLPAIYSGAAALVMPSVYEGFGLPVIEAMACGTPAICSRAGALAETAGPAALLFDPSDPHELSSAIRRVLLDPQERELLRQRGFERAAAFSWSQTAAGVRAVLEEEAGNYGSA
jgi:glycosyltransferase involved in cell wall biosynthesis